MNFQEATLQLRDNERQAPALSDWKHTKSGTSIRVEMHVIDETSLKPMIVYSDFNSRISWARPATQFFDGRFTRIDNGDTQ